MDVKKINSDVVKCRQELLTFVMQKNSNNLKDTSLIRKKKKEIARLLTERNK